MRKQRRVVPTVVTFGTIIGRAAKARRPELALRVWHDMTEAGVRPDVPATNALLNAYAKAATADDGNSTEWADRAVQMLKGMRGNKSPLTPNIITSDHPSAPHEPHPPPQTHRSSPPTHRSSPPTAQKQHPLRSLLSALCIHPLPPSARRYNTVIDAVGRSGDLPRASRLLLDMANDGIQPNERTYSILIHSCARLGRVDDAFALVRHMHKLHGLEPNAVTYSTLISACDKAGDLSRALQVGYRVSPPPSITPIYTPSPKRHDLRSTRRTPRPPPPPPRARPLTAFHFLPRRLTK